MNNYAYITIIAILLSAHTRGAAADLQAASFDNLYTTICLKHLNNLDVLRKKLAAIPALPPAKAAAFLGGAAGSAWSVPDKHGIFVIAVHAQQDMCSVFARRVDAAQAAKRFSGLLRVAPQPLTSRQTADATSTSPRNGFLRSVSYEWSHPGVPRKMVFTLTTATASTADLQAIATAAISR